MMMGPPDADLLVAVFDENGNEIIDDEEQREHREVTEDREATEHCEVTEDIQKDIESIPDIDDADEAYVSQEEEHVPKKRASARLREKAAKMAANKKPIIRSLLKKGASRDNISIKKKNRTLMKSTDFIPDGDSSENVIHLIAPSQSRPGVQYSVYITYEYPNITVKCNCGQQFGVNRRSNCYHVQSVMNVIFENYFKDFLQDHSHASHSSKKSHEPDSRKRRRTNDMEVDVEMRIERNSREEREMDSPDQGQNQNQSANEPEKDTIIDFLTQMVENFGISRRKA